MSEYLRLKEIIKQTFKMEFVSDDQRKAVFANLEGSSDKDVLWKDNDYKTTAVYKEPIVLDYVGIGMMKEHTAGVSKDKIDDEENENFGKYGVQDDITHELHFFDTREEAKNKASEMVKKLPPKYKYAKDIIKNNGKEMVSKYAGKDIYGNQVNPGDKIIYFNGKLIKV